MIDYLLISVFAFVFCNVLIQPGEIFSFVKPALAKLFGKEPYEDLSKLTGIKYGIYKIVVCQDCQAGEIALWYSIYLLITIGGNPLYYILMITLSIAGAHFLNVINNYLKTNDTCSN